MFKQKGQSAVELAIILPTFFIFVFAILYTGLMFMDYIQFSNAARAAARDIAFKEDTKDDTEAITNTRKTEIRRAEIRDGLNEQKQTYIKAYSNPLTTLYTPKFEVTLSDKNVTVKISFERNDDDLPLLLDNLNFPPKNLSPITYTMPLEE